MDKIFHFLLENQGMPYTLKAQLPQELKSSEQNSDSRYKMTVKHYF